MGVLLFLMSVVIVFKICFKNNQNASNESKLGFHIMNQLYNVYHYAFPFFFSAIRSKIKADPPLSLPEPQLGGDMHLNSSSSDILPNYVSTPDEPYYNTPTPTDRDMHNNPAYCVSGGGCY